MSAFSIERNYRVYNDDTGDYIQVGPDADGLDLVDIRQNDNGKDVARITVTKEHARLIAEAIGEFLQAQK